MDLLTHALVGAAAGAATRRGTGMRQAALAGAAAALLVDLDYFIGSANDPLLQIEFHRHFSHSLAFIPLGALLATALLWPVLGRRLGGRSLYLATLAGYATHWMIDVCTSYGVHLFWPFADTRVALDLLSVVDPVFTLLVGVPVILALWRQQRSILLGTAILGALYVGFAAWQQQRAEGIAEALADTRGHATEGLLLRPSFGNTLVWRSVYRHGDRWYLDAVRPGFVTEAQAYTGGSVPVFDRARDLPDVPEDSRIGRDIGRLDRLSDGYLVWVSSANRMGDIRFSAVPDGVSPMWGLEFDPEAPDEPPNWFIDRELTPDMRERFLDQLRGRPH